MASLATPAAAVRLPDGARPGDRVTAVRPVVSSRLAGLLPEAAGVVGRLSDAIIAEGRLIPPAARANVLGAAGEDAEPEGSCWDASARLANDEGKRAALLMAGRLTPASGRRAALSDVSAALANAVVPDAVTDEAAGSILGVDLATLGCWTAAAAACDKASARRALRLGMFASDCNVGCDSLRRGRLADASAGVSGRCGWGACVCLRLGETDAVVRRVNLVWVWASADAERADPAAQANTKAQGEPIADGRR